MRLELNPGGAGSLDGLWWPRSRDLADELPDLLATLLPRLGPIHRVIYHLDEWSSAARKLEFGGRQIRLDGYRRLPARTLEVLAVSAGTRLTLQILAPLADFDMTAAQQRWDSEGGAAAYDQARTSVRNQAVSSDIPHASTSKAGNCP
ncbi:hypothetical protein D7D52_20370 [Nocardia yunnanensis]|uniref:Uncharacterized protein n=1 Tax=Nocardia yunnanensis TaxID=2382165 RepID=A0A386ZGU3_9NOCA|nr:DUF5994 family protein [Nocardia yunnanensis]AYF75805.1 hypothetical protein D7D52_20370 [Nocardia yunnanensis]